MFFFVLYRNMLDWLEKENMFDIVFGESIHVELISRALPLLTFLYENNKMSNERLDLIFDLAHGKHEVHTLKNKIFTFR